MKNLIAAIMTLTASAVCAGQEYHWNGGSGDWNEPGNWTPQAIPSETDDVYIAGGADAESAVEIDIKNVSVEAGNPAARCWSIHLSGYVTFNNSGEGYLDVTGVDGGMRTVYTEKAGVYTFNCPLDLSNADGSGVIKTWHGTTYLNGGYRYYWGHQFFYGGGHDEGGHHTKDELHFNGGLDPEGSGYSALCFLLGCQWGVIHVDKGNNWFYRIQLTSRFGEMHVNCDNPWITNPSDFDYTYLAGGAKMYLHGHDVTFPKHTELGDAADIGYGFVSVVNTDEGQPATLTFQELNTAVVLTNNMVNFTGPLTIKMSEDSRGTLPLNRQIDTTGAILIEGGVWDLCPQASFPGISYLRVSKNGKIRLADGVSYTVPKLYLGEDEYQVEPGTYGAPDNPNAYFKSEYLEGRGLIVVPEGGEPETVSATWSGQGYGADIRTMENWVGSPSSLPFRDGGLLPTFAAGGTQAVVADDVRFKGIVFDAASDFLLTGNGLVKLGSLALFATNRLDDIRQYTVDTPLELRAAQTWNVGAGTTVTVQKAISAYSNMDHPIAVSGAGAVVLSGDNTFPGSMTVSDGATVIARGASALGKVSSESAYTAQTVYIDQSQATLMLDGVTLEKNLKTTGSASGDLRRLCYSGANVVRGDYLTAAADYPWFMPGATLTVYGEMTGWGGTYFAPKSADSENIGSIYARGPVTIECLTPQNVHFHVCTNGNSFGRNEVSRGGTLHYHAPFANLRTDAYAYIVGASHMDLHGTDQVAGDLELYNTSAGAFVTAGEEGPATLYINHAEICAAANNYCDLAGQLSISMGGGGLFLQNHAASSTGDLTVTNGTWCFQANGSWLNGGTFTASGVSDDCKGRISLSQSETFSKDSKIVLDGKGSLELASGVRQKCSELRIDGEVMPFGTYGSSSSNAQFKDDVHFAGTGIVKICGGGLTVTIR